MNKGEDRANKAKENYVITQGLKKGFSMEILADLTGLSPEDVTARIKELSLGN
ncbi:MAG: hypothetical protein AAF694_31455 [Bacteroidota bacterium]